MSLPKVEVVRERINSIEDSSIRFCLIGVYLFSARISEVIGKTYAGQNPAYGPIGTDVNTDYHGTDRAAIFHIKTAKREGRKRLIALPLDPHIEPWTEPLMEYFKESKEQIVFPFSRQHVSRYLKLNKVFDGLSYPIETYIIIRKNLGLFKKVDRHIRAFTIHALRHLRATELVEYYGFDGFNLAAYGGWTIKTATGAATTMFDRYLSLSWQSYFPKLLKKRMI